MESKLKTESKTEAKADVQLSGKRNYETDNATAASSSSSAAASAAAASVSAVSATTAPPQKKARKAKTTEMTTGEVLSWFLAPAELVAASGKPGADVLAIDPGAANFAWCVVRPGASPTKPPTVLAWCRVALSHGATPVWKLVKSLHAHFEGKKALFAGVHTVVIENQRGRNTTTYGLSHAAQMYFHMQQVPAVVYSTLRVNRFLDEPLFAGFEGPAKRPTAYKARKRLAIKMAAWMLHKSGQNDARRFLERFAKGDDLADALVHAAMHVSTNAKI